MKYLLDVNALIALKHARSPHHQLCRAWAVKTGIDALATSAITELGFLRVSMAAYGVSLTDALKDLADLKKRIVHFVEKSPSPSLPAWADTASKTTDAYLMQLAKSAGLQLATFDTGISGALLIR
jgi:predicted nucleic acid-binding protein